MRVGLAEALTHSADGDEGMSRVAVARVTGDVDASNESERGPVSHCSRDTVSVPALPTPCATT